MQKGLRKNKPFRKVLLDYIKREVGSSMQSATVSCISPVVRSEHEIVAAVDAELKGHERHYSN
jgi:hypothetical protein